MDLKLELGAGAGPSGPGPEGGPAPPPLLYLSPEEREALVKYRLRASLAEAFGLVRPADLVVDSFHLTTPAGTPCPIPLCP